MLHRLMDFKTLKKIASIFILLFGVFASAQLPPFSFLKSSGGGPVMLTYSGATHTEGDCVATGGEVVATPSGKLCRMNRTSCLSGWTQADNWSTATNNTVSCSSVAVSARTHYCLGSTLSFSNLPSASGNITANGYSWSNPSANHNRVGYEYTAFEANPIVENKYNYTGPTIPGCNHGIGTTNAWAGNPLPPSWRVGSNGLCNTGIGANAAYWGTATWVDPSYPGGMAADPYYADYINVFHAYVWSDYVYPSITQIGCK